MWNPQLTNKIIMENTQIEENTEKILNFRISPNVYISDLYNLEKNCEIRYEVACIYLSQITRGTGISFAPLFLPSDTPQISLIDNWNAVLQGPQTFFVFPQCLNFAESREFMKNKLKSEKKTVQIQEFRVDCERLQTFALLGLIKIWVEFQGHTANLLGKLNYDTIARETQKEVEKMLISRAKTPLPTILSKLSEVRSTGPVVFSKVFSEKVLEKPTIEISIQSSKDTMGSFEYSDSEMTERFEELSFKASEAISNRFPRFSAASITVFETPSKDLKTSFIEYTEMLDSPSHHLQGSQISSITPVDSPKQSLFTINEVKNFLNNSTIIENFEHSSPIPIDKNQGFNRNRFEFDELKSSLRTEMTNSSDNCKARINCEGRKNLSCECGSCVVM